MNRYWELITQPLLHIIQPSRILEIGAEYGKGTDNLIKYCEKSGCSLVSIDPAPLFDASGQGKKNDSFFTFHQALSLDVLPSIPPCDTVLLDGDHNWYTVFNELKQIEKNSLDHNHNFPVILLHDIGWPYGRRDLYYDPETIPEEFRHPYKRQGMIPGESDLVEKDGLNSQYCNAAHENGPKNGVRTAIEDFLDQSSFRLQFTILPGLYGLGILYPLSLYNKNGEFRTFIQQIQIPSLAVKIMEQVEIDRILKQMAVNRRDEHISILNTKIKAIASERDRSIDQQKLQLQERKLKEQERKLQEQERKRQEQERKINKQTHTIDQLKKQVSHYEQRIKNLTSLQETINANILALINSNRWKIGNKFGDILRIVCFKKPVPTVANVITKQIEQLGSIKKSVMENTKQLSSAQNHFKKHCETIYSVSTVNRVLPALSGPPVSIIVPVYNAYNETKACIESILEYTSIDFRLILINDCSPDKRIKGLLDSYKEDSRITIRTNPENQGFVSTVNNGINACSTDVVLLNSDTLVTPRWLQKLIIAAYFESKIATVTPFSNASGAFSVPEPGKNQALLPWLTPETAAYRIERAVIPQYPRVPTGNGFCMYIKRAVIDEIGIFDEENFKQGYGEENDFCMRAMKKGWENIIDDSGFIYHKNSASFGDNKTDLIKTNRKILDRLHPEYTGLVRKFIHSKEINSIRTTIGKALEAPADDKRSALFRILYVMHEGTGGTPATNQDLMQHVSRSHECFLLTSTGSRVILRSVFKDRSEEIFSYDLKHRWSAGRFECDEFKALYFSILVNLKIELVHIRHLFKHNFILPSLCKQLGVAVVFSFHDFYHMCPSFHLLDQNLRYCKGRCDTADNKQCNIPTPMLSDLPNLCRYLPEWRTAVSNMLTCCQTFITTCNTAKELYTQAYPQLETQRFSVIEHGRDFPENRPCAVLPEKNHKIKILVPGNIDSHKGCFFIKALFDYDKEDKIEFHFMGVIPEMLENCGVYHGSYNRDSFHEKACEIQPSFAAIFSIWPETYCHTLSEAWASGLPVLSFDFGAVGERIKKHKAGWFLDPDNIQTSFDRIIEIAGNPEAYQKALANVAAIRFKTTREMADQYLFEYKNAVLKLKNRRFPHKTIGLFTPGGEKGFPGSSYIRCLLMLQHPELEKYYSFKIIDNHIIDQGGTQKLKAFVERSAIDCLMIQRDVLVGQNLDKVLEFAGAAHLPVIYELDDNLMGIGPDHPEYAAYEPKIKSIEKLCTVADLVTVSTHELKKRVAPYTSKIEVIQNALDETLWLSSDAAQARKTEDSDQKTIHIGYMGTFTHTRDLEMIRQVIQDVRQILAREHKVKMEFQMIGGIPDKLSVQKPWYTRVRIPENEYPKFTAWLKKSIHWDIALAPLDANKLNAGKSELKFLEYTAMGAVGIYSDYGAYGDAVVHGETGFLVKNDEDAVENWKKYMIRLALDSELRQQILARARQTLYQEYLLKQRVRQWRRAFDNVIQDVAVE